MRDNLSALRTMHTVWNSFPRAVLRADLLRYLLLWFYGGFDADVDVVPTQSLESCPPLAPLFWEGRSFNISLVVGVEIDEPFVSQATREKWKWSRTFGFAQYALYAPQRFSPILRRVIVRSIAHAIRHQERQRFWNRYTDVDVLEVTGPGMFTDSVLDVISSTLPINHEWRHAVHDGHRCPAIQQAKERNGVTWLPFHNLTQSTWTNAGESEGRLPLQRHGGLMVLPINVWGNGQRHSGAETFRSSHACINHRFVRTWKHAWF